ncbi:hypothetical protein M5689_018934 [Euphorbia peplus]|nr:hypothetical protein M5689_018934 [Euphorbia peplus]
MVERPSFRFYGRRDGSGAICCSSVRWSESTEESGVYGRDLGVTEPGVGHDGEPGPTVADMAEEGVEFLEERKRRRSESAFHCSNSLGSTNSMDVDLGGSQRNNFTNSED